MQFSNLFTILALAMTATALPAAEEADNILAPRTGGGANQCSATNSGNRKTVCCNGFLNCVVAINTCNSDQSVWCCKNAGTPVSFPIRSSIVNSVRSAAGDL
jgi:hypothetical protein